MMKRMISTLLCLGAIACGGADFDDAEFDGVQEMQSEDALMNTGGPGTEGGACTVVGGANKGKKGTYDGDGSCCNEAPVSQGGWGCTDCNDTSGNDNGKCKAGIARPPIRHPAANTTTGGAVLSRGN